MGIEVKTEIRVYSKNGGEWGATEAMLGVESYWNDDRGDFATIVIENHAYTVSVRDLRAALTAVTSR